MAVKSPAVMMCAAGSGSGKTLITCGLLRAIKRRGVKVEAFKCGPDYIDPMFHQNVIGVPSKNLDSYFLDEKMLNYLFEKDSTHRELAVVEGVMGYYDGIGGVHLKASSYEVSDLLDIPAVLIVSCKGMSGTIAAVVKGMASYRENSRIRGVILNRIPKMLYPGMKKLVEKETGVSVVGYVPELEALRLESRHLGLKTPDTVEELEKKFDELAKILEETIEIDQILKLADTRMQNTVLFEEAKKDMDKFINDHKLQENIRIAVAKDEAFCFLYEDNLRLLEALGAKLCFFSPIHDRKLPKDIRGLILPGGYPELYCKGLSENEEMQKEIREAVKKKVPVLAECGGFLYLHEYLEDENRKLWPMTGIVKGKAFKTEKLSRFGYIQVTSQKDQLLLKKGESIRAHEFHYWDSEHPGEDCVAEKASGTRKWDCIQGTDTMYAGFPHIYFYANRKTVLNFLKGCQVQ